MVFFGCLFHCFFLSHLNLGLSLYVLDPYNCTDHRWRFWPHYVSTNIKSCPFQCGLSVLCLLICEVADLLPITFLGPRSFKNIMTCGFPYLWIFLWNVTPKYLWMFFIKHIKKYSKENASAT